MTGHEVDAAPGTAVGSSDRRRVGRDDEGADGAGDRPPGPDVTAGELDPAPRTDGPRVDGGLPETAWWVALSGLPAMGPARLQALRDLFGGEEAWAEVVAGRGTTPAAVAEVCGRRATEVASEWARAASGLDVAAVWAAHADLQVVAAGDPGFPERLALDVDPPVLLFADGDLAALTGPTVAVVGTRRCTRAGADTAREIGLACARAGACVVSGLAVGIDTAAHEGALAAGAGGGRPVAVVGSGLDVVYPARSRRLWRAVAEAGAVLSEYPLGTEPARWRFPARNRLVAALADVVVVVESPRSGGSMYTVDEALRRERTVLAVPGSVRSAASAGSNWLLSQGAAPACAVDDVLVALHLEPRSADDGTLLDPRPRPDGDGRKVLRALGWEPAGLDLLAQRTGLALGPLAVAVDRLEVDGWVARSGARVERRSAP